MIISEKQITLLMNQLRDHIALHERLSIIQNTNKDYLYWLCELRDEITEQQTQELRVVE